MYPTQLPAPLVGGSAFAIACGGGRRTQDQAARSRCGCDLVDNITVSNQGDHDEAIFEFTGTSIPGWAVQFVAHAVLNGTRDMLPIPGQSILEVLIFEAPGPFTAPKTYTGPPVVSNPDSSQIIMVQYATYGKGVTQAFIGLNGVQPAFSVSALTDPTRIVVDVAH